MKYTVSEAAKIVGATRQTIYRHIDSKPLLDSNTKTPNSEHSWALMIYQRER